MKIGLDTKMSNSDSFFIGKNNRFLIISSNTKDFIVGM